jgi:hypothetical protein
MHGWSTNHWITWAIFFSDFTLKSSFLLQKGTGTFPSSSASAGYKLILSNRRLMVSRKSYFTRSYYGENNFSFTINIIYLLTPWSRVLLVKLTGSQLVKKFPALYGTRSFIAEFRSVRHLYLSSARSIKSMPPHPSSWRSILILSSHLQLGLPSDLFPSSFSPKPRLCLCNFYWPNPSGRTLALGSTRLLTETITRNIS